MKPGPLIADIEGVELTQVDREVLLHPKLGGLIFFSRNFEDKSQISDLVRSIREVRQDLILCVDQEGGRVQRFRNGFTALPPMASICGIASELDLPAPELATDLGWLMATELAEVDLDHSFAPVLDLHLSESSVIGDRAFSDDPCEVETLAGAFIRGMQQAGMAATAKHFPGHGGVCADSHIELPEDSRSFEEIRHRDLVPFVGLQNQYAAIMTAHIAFTQVDANPVSFSRYWLKDILREQLEYTGLVLSDDLSMKGAEASGDFKDRAAKALGAGCDAILICNERAHAEQVLEYLEHEGLGDSGKLSTLKRDKTSTSTNSLERKRKTIQALEGSVL